MTKATLATAGLGAVLGEINSENKLTNSQSLLDLLKNRVNSNATFSINGDTVATRKKTKDGIKTNYNLSDSEQNLLDYTNTNILNALQNLNVFSDDVQKRINEQVNAYKEQGLRELNDRYTPMFRELKTDIASRFGNLDNSIFLDNLNEIEKNRTNALATLTENILAKQDELYNSELTNRYNYLEALTNTNENIYSKILNFLQLAN